MKLIKSIKGNRGKIHIGVNNDKWSLCNMVSIGKYQHIYRNTDVAEYIDYEGEIEEVTCGTCLYMLEKENNER